MIQPWTWK